MTIDHYSSQSTKDYLLDRFLSYGLGIGAIFQFVCILAVIFLSSGDSKGKSNLEYSSEDDMNNGSHHHNGSNHHCQAGSKHNHGHGRRNRHEKKKRK